MRCEEIMRHDVECLTPQDPVETAARKMRDKNIGFLPVCDKGKILGALTDRDIALRVVADKRPTTIPVGEVMTRETVTVKASDDLSKAHDVMAKHHKSRVMCVDDAGRIVGVISLSDIAQHEKEASVGRTMREVTKREVHKR